MNCFNCGNEVIRGQLKIVGNRGLRIKWTSDSELKKEGLLNRLRRKSLNIEIDGFISCNRESWYCQHCNKVFSDFELGEYVKVQSEE